MDFLDPKRTRKHSIRLLLGYFLIAIAISFGALILLFQSYGYDLDRKTGKIIQNGLMFVSSTPDGAEIYIDGEDNRSKTDTRLTIPSGQYVVELKLPGYRNWKRSVSLEGGSVERLTYPLLIPEVLAPADTQLYATPLTYVTQSPDRRWLLIWQPGSLNNIDVFDTNNINQEPKPIALAADLLTPSAEAHRLEFMEWAKDNRHFLVRHHYGANSEFVWIDREQPAESINLSRRLGNAITMMSFRDRDDNQLYILEGASQKLNTYTVSSQAIQPLLEGVIDYRTKGRDMVLYTSADSTATSPTTNFRIWDGSSNYLLRSFPTEPKYLFDISQNRDDWLVALGPSSGSHIYIYKNPVDQLKSKDRVAIPLSVLKLNEPKSLSFSSSAAYLEVQSGAKFGVYDYDSDRRYYYDLKQQFSDTLAADWIDEDRLSVTVADHAYIFDFDGSNPQSLTPTLAGFKPYFNRDYTELFNIAPSAVVPGRYALTTTEMRVQ